jgi:hypothetical protein
VINWDTIPRVGGAFPGSGPDPGSIVVAEDRRQIGFLFGFLILVFVLALVRGVTGGQTTGDRVAAAVFCVVVIAVLAGGGFWMIRRPARLEVGVDAVRFVQRDGHASALSRQSGNELRFVKQHRSALSRIWTLGVGVVGTDTVIELPGFFARNAIRKACGSCGWRFVN